MRKRRRRGPGPIGTIVLIWVFFAIILPLVRLSGGLIAAGIVNLPVALLLLYSLRNMLEDTEYTR